MRLTARNKKEVAYWIEGDSKCYVDSYDNIYGDAIDKLAEYEDLEEQGLLLRLPCKVGQTVWYMAREILQCKVRAVVSSFYDEAEIYLKYDGENDLLEHWRTSVGMDEIGKTVFFTKEEAEQALERMEKEK